MVSALPGHRAIITIWSNLNATYFQLTTPDCLRRNKFEGFCVAWLNVNGSLVAGVLAGIGASVCCVGPLVLLRLGISGAWIGNLSALEPVRPIFIVITLIFLGLAMRRPYLVPQVFEAGTPCADPATIKRQRMIFWLVSVALAGLLVRTRATAASSARSVR